MPVIGGTGLEWADMSQMMIRVQAAQAESSVAEVLEANAARMLEARDLLESLEAQIPEMRAEGQDTSAIEQELSDTLGQVGGIWQQLEQESFEGSASDAEIVRPTTNEPETDSPPADTRVQIEQLTERMEELNGTLRDLLEEGQDATDDAIRGIGAQVDSPASASLAQQAAAGVDEVAGDPLPTNDTNDLGFEVTEATEVAADFDAADWKQDEVADLQAEAKDYADDGEFETAEILEEDAGDAEEIAEGYADAADDDGDDDAEPDYVAYDGD